MYIIDCRAHFCHLLGLGQVGHSPRETSGTAGSFDWCPMWMGSQSTCHPNAPLIPLQAPYTPVGPWSLHSLPDSNAPATLPTLPDGPNAPTPTPLGAPNATDVPYSPTVPWAPTLPANPNAPWHPYTPDGPNTPWSPNAPWCPIPLGTPMPPDALIPCWPLNPYTPYQP